jgi:hypothetical protein
MISAGLYDLCDPAFYYLLISMIIIIWTAFQNIGQGHYYCVGTQVCPNTNVYTIFIIKIIYVLVWTWILNLLCKNELTVISWVLVLIPIILMLLFMAMQFSNLFDFSRLFYLPNLFN